MHFPSCNRVGQVCEYPKLFSLGIFVIYLKSGWKVQTTSFPFPFSLRSSFRLALRIISSRLRCKRACRSFLLLLQLDVVPAFSPSSGGSAEDIFSPRLYRLIKSICSELFGCALLVFAVLGVVPCGGNCGWKDGGGYYDTLVSDRPRDCSISRSISNEAQALTASRLPVFNILSVVAAALPPFLCKSHIISLLPT